MNLDMKSKVLKIRNLPQNRKRIDCINSKPYLFILISLGIGILFLLFEYYFVGVIISGIFLYNLVCIKNKLILEFYEDYAVFYADQKKDECYILFWEDIASWTYHKGRNDLDTIEVKLKDDRHVCFPCFSRRKIVKYFTKYTAQSTHRCMDQHAG